jgi:hypothetical protein
MGEGVRALMSNRSVSQERASILAETDRLYEGCEELEELLDALLAAHSRELMTVLRDHGHNMAADRVERSGI